MITEEAPLVKTPVSPSTVIDRLGYGRFQLLLFVSFTLFCWVLVLGVGITGFIMFIVDTNWKPSAAEIALFGSMMILTSGLGFSLSIILEPRFGRWKLVIWGQVFAILFSIASSFAPEYYTLMVTRFFTLTGIHLSTSPAYSAFPEMVPSQYRGVFASVSELLGCFASITVWAYLYVFIPDLDGEGWRLMQLLLCLIFTVPLVVLCYYLIEESPVYLWQINQPEKAIQALNQIAAFNRQLPVTEEEARAIRSSEFPMQQSLIKITALCTGKYEGVGLIMFWQWFVHQLGYLGVLSVYPYFVGGDDLEASETLTSFLIYSLAVLPAVLLLVFIIDKPGFGRRVSLILLKFISAAALVAPVIVLNDTIVIISMAIFMAAEHALIALMFLFTLEIYETTLRNAAIAYFNLTSGVLVAGALYGVMILVEFSLRLSFILLGTLEISALISLVWLQYETKGILLDGDTVTEAEKEGHRRAAQTIK